MAETNVVAAPRASVGSDVTISTTGGGGAEVAVPVAGGVEVAAPSVGGVEVAAPTVESSVPYAQASEMLGVGGQEAVPSQQQVGQAVTAEQVSQTASNIRNVSDQVRKELGGFAAKPQAARSQGLTSRREEPISKRPMFASDAAAAERARAEDTPYPTETIRRDQYSPDLIEAAVESDESVDDWTMPNDDRRASEARTRQEEVLKATAKSRNLRSSMAQSAVTRTSVKPSIFERETGYTKRRKARVQTDNAPNHRPKPIVRGLKKSISRRFGRKGTGVRIYGKIIPLPTLGFREVGVGMQEIAAVIDQNPDMLDELLRQSLPAEKLTTFTSTRSMLLGEVVDLINGGNVEVFTAKPPNNRGQDVQRRRLHVLESEQRGIYLHPIMAAMYTADFDGDDMQISLDPTIVKNAKDPMAHMVGIDGEQSLDMSFLPVSELEDGYEEGKTKRDYVREVMLSKWNNRINDMSMTAFNQLIDSVLKLSETTLQGSDNQAAAYGDVFRAARKFADVYTSTTRTNSSERDSDRVMGDVTESVYQGMKNLRVNNALMTVGEVIPRDSMPAARNVGDHALFKLVDGMVMGAVPNNFQELKVMMNGFLGNVSGKSAPFRFTADVGKMMKLDKRFIVGSEYVVDPDNVEDMKDFLENTVKFAYSKRMAVDVKTSGKSMYFTEVLRNNVIREVGFPENYETMYDFLMTFVESYNRNAAIINEANLIWLTNMGISKKSNRKTVAAIKNVKNDTVTYSDIASAFIEAYGTYSFDRIFGSYKGLMEYQQEDARFKSGENAIEVDWRRTSSGRRLIMSKYKLMSLKAFSVKNHIIMESKERSALADNRLSNARSDLDMLDGMIAAISDKRSSLTSKFNTDVIGMYDSRDGKRGHIKETGSQGRETGIYMMQKVLKDIDKLDLNESENFDQMLYVDDAVMTLNAINYEMFRELGMDGTANFLASDFGYKLVKHSNDLDVIAGIHAAMVFKWQTLRITSIADRLRELDADPGSSVAEYLNLKNRAKFEMDRLSNKSNVWEGILNEMRSKPSESAFRQLSTAEGRRGIKFWMAPDFWSSEHGYTSLRQVIEDLDMPWSLKCDIITDVVRWQTQDYHVNNFEIAFQMEVGGDSSLFALEGGSPQASMRAYNDMESASNRYADQSFMNLRQEVQDAVRQHRDKPGILTNTIHRLAESPWELVHFDDAMYADVILAVREKLYPQTEKAQKHPATNAAYHALSNQRNGGFFNDVYRYDDRVLGLQSSSQLSAMDLLKILDDPNHMLTVYDEYGNISYLNQRTLLNIDHVASETEIWDFLVNNPRLACVLRAGVSCATTDTKGNGYIGARLSLSETIEKYGDGGHDMMGHMKYLMRDHPVYAGLISLLTHGHGTVSRNERNRVPLIEEAVCRELYRAAAQDGEMAAGNVLSRLGIERRKLRSLLISDYDKYMKSLGFNWDLESVGEAQEEADDIYDTLERHIASYIDEIKREVPFDPSFVSDYREYRNSSKKIKKFRGKYDFLSNFYRADVTIDGITYKNAEAAFQAQKTTNRADRVKFAKLNGSAARKLGQEISLRPDWESVKEDVMRQVISAKFSDPNMRELLMSTGDAELIEGNTWDDTTWGVSSNGVGRNLLGKILMEERGPVAMAGAVADISIDAESLASFWDAVQELSGAKVGVSTGIEGSETYQLSYWVTHMGAKDHYADLEAIADLIYDYYNPLAFDGMWTNKGPLSVQVNELGDIVTNINELRASKENEGDEIVTMVPEGFEVPDRSTDSYGTQVPSLYASMVSKRSNGAEKFNLKAMKAGLDGTDSVTKMRGKYLNKKFMDGTSAPVLFMQIRTELEQIAQEQGINEARVNLANRMMEQDREMGYEDMSLANYVCLAEVMLIENEDGDITLRSLEQLATAMRGRIGSRVDEMTDKEVSAEISSIMNDTSEDGVGNSIVWDAREVLSELRPRRTAGDAASSVRISSSVFTRNYELLSEIAKSSKVQPMDPSERDEAHDSIIGIKEGKGVSGVEEVWRRSNVIRNYQVIGYAGAEDGSMDLSRENIGPSTAIVIGDYSVDAKLVKDICDKAYDNATTVIISKENLSTIPDKYAADMIPVNDEGDMMLPMFDMRLNGSEARPTQPRFSIFKVPFQRYVISAEDPFNVFELGDAQYKFTQALVSRLRSRDSGQVRKTAMDLFPNVFANKEYKNANFSVSMANGRLVRDLICRDPQCTIDYGIVEGAEGFGQRVHDVNAAIRRYRDMIDLADDQDSVLRGVDNIEPGDIVAWVDMKIELDGQPPQHVLAPLIPFQLHEGKRTPESFTVVQVGPDKADGSLFSVDWKYDRSVTSGGYAKYFDSSGGANKGMINLSDIIEDVMRLKNGMDVDAYCASASTDGRKIGTDRRIKTMISLMAMARMEGYNFARTDGAFPNDPDIREALIKNRLPLEFWATRYEAEGVTENPIVFTNDKELNAFIDYECRKIFADGGNPSDYLASVFEDEDGNDVNENVMWEFECMFDNSLHYEDSLLRFLHTVNPDLCPNGIDDATENTLFRLYRDGDDLGAGFDRGILQMQVPYPMSDGRIAYVWSNVYIGMSFFGEEYSDNSRPNINGASDMLDAENTEAYYGAKLDKGKQSDRAAWSTAGYARPARDGGAFGSVMG